MPSRALLPHHDGSPLYVSTDAPGLGDRVGVRVRIHSSWSVRAVRVRSNPDKEPQWVDASLETTIDGFEWWRAEVRVDNLVHRYRFMLDLADGATGWLSAAGFSELETLDADDFALVAYPPPPAWAKSTVLYQIFPDRFARSSAADSRALPAWAEPAAWSDEPIHKGPSTPRQFYGGDLAGIEEYLDHIERLGATMIYLTPFFPAHSNHRYDALSFDEVDELLGGSDALASLVAAAHSRGLRVIGDLTSNHSGDAHEWFTTSHLSPGAEESDFYYWLDPEQRSYASWFDVPSLPKFNWNSPELRRRFAEIVAKWLRPPFNLDGWRIDVANMTGRHLDHDLNAEVRQLIRRAMVEVNPDTILLAESTNDAAADFQGDAWHGAMTYANFTKPVWGWLSQPVDGGWFFGVPYPTTPTYSGAQLVAAHERFAAGFPWRVRLHNMNALDTHDTARFATHALPGAIPVALGLSVTLPGIPTVFAGDEFGLVGVNGEHSRSPIPWGGAYETSIALYTELIALRRSHPALNEGSLRWLFVGDDVLVYIREHATESVLVAASRADFDLTLDIALEGGSRIFGTADVAGSRLSGRGPSFTAWQLAGVDLPPFRL